MNRLSLYFKSGFLLLLLCVCGCAPQPRAGLGGLSGRLSGTGARWPGQTLWVFAAPYYGETQADGFYVLDATVHPQTALKDNGAFRLMDLPPGNYVLVAGPSAEEALAVVDEAQRPRVFSVNADEVTDLGALSLTP